MSDTARGLGPLLGYAILSAAVDVYAGNMLQSISAISLAAVSFTFAAVFFGGLDALRNGAAAVLRPLREHRLDVLGINVTTAGTWLTLLYALRHLEPAVVNVIAFSVGPALTALAGPLMRRGSTVLRAELWVSGGILAVITAMMVFSATGLSGIRDVSRGEAALGLALALLCGLFCTGNVIFSKRLSDRGLTPLNSLSVRYFLVVVLCWALTAGSGGDGLGRAVLPGLVIAVIGIALPMYLGQVGIKYVEPMTASLIDALSPVAAVLLQLPDGRLHPSPHTIAGILAITALVGVGVLARDRAERRAAVRPPPVPAHPQGELV